MQKGKIIGGILGFCLGGPLGGILGYMAGRTYDHARLREDVWAQKGGSGFDSFSVFEENRAFAVGVIVLSAKMARADGKVTSIEIQAFRRAFEINPAYEANVAETFNQARLSPDGFEPYAHRLALIFGNRPSVLEGILSALFVIAAADAELSEQEIAFLKQVSAIFGFDIEAFMRIAARSGVNLGSGQRTGYAYGPDEQSGTQDTSFQNDQTPESYIILGTAETATNAEIKQAYRTLIREHHPDKLMAQGVPPEFIAAATEKMKRINAAYDTICKLRGI